MNNIKNKNIIIAIVIIMVGILIIGGTYAYLSISATVTNGNYATSTRCFDIDYDDGSSENIIGTVSDNNLFMETDGNYENGYINGALGGGTPYITFSFSEPLQAGKSYVFSFDASADFSPISSATYKFPSSTDEYVSFQDGTNTLTFTVTESISQGSIILNNNLVIIGEKEFLTITLSNFSLYEAEAPSTLFPTGNPGGGLLENISFKTSSTCNTNGRGTYYLHVDSGTSQVLTSTVAPHCENKYTLETVKDLNALDCVFNENTVWVTNGTALKYALYDSTDRTHLYAAGYIDSTFIGQDKAIHTDFSVSGTQKTYYLYIWLDGYVSDDTYNDLPFSATSRLSVTQTKSTDTTFTGDSYTTISNSIYQYNNESLYQQVEYIQSTGTQYIDTGMKMSDINKVTGTFSFVSTSAVQGLFGRWTSNSTTIQLIINPTNNQICAKWLDSNSCIEMNTSKHSFELSSENTIIDGDVMATYSKSNASDNVNVVLFARRSDNSGTGLSNYANVKLYNFQIYSNNVPVRAFVPVYRKSDNKPGLLDTVNGVFYTNAATSGNDFTLGPNVS